LRRVSSFDVQSNKSSIDHSGNSDVDVNVNVQVDTTPIAFAILCSLLATGQFSNEEFELAVRKLEELTNNKKSYSARERDGLSKVKLFNIKR
jgi:hypothetical protein